MKIKIKRSRTVIVLKNKINENAAYACIKIIFFFLNLNTDDLVKVRFIYLGTYIYICAHYVPKINYNILIFMYILY